MNEFSCVLLKYFVIVGLKTFTLIWLRFNGVNLMRLHLIWRLVFYASYFPMQPQACINLAKAATPFSSFLYTAVVSSIFSQAMLIAFVTASPASFSPRLVSCAIRPRC